MWGGCFPPFPAAHSQPSGLLWVEEGVAWRMHLPPPMCLIFWGGVPRSYTFSTHFQIVKNKAVFQRVLF